MKGIYKRFIDKQKRRAETQFCNEMASYSEVLKQLTAVGDGKSYRQDEQPLTTRLKPGEVYAVRCEDRPEYYRTVLLKKVELTGGIQVMVSNPVYGDTPDGIQEVPQEQVFKQMRELNAGTSMASLNAFPFNPGEGKF